MKKKLSFIFLFLVYFSKVSFSQSESENLNKYWNYRDRLKKYFLKIGNGPGESLPAENRCEGCIQNGNLITSKIRWGDATIHLGYYIAVLASEYKLLMDAQQFEEAQKTKNELFYAIQAANRLDFNAEGYLGAPNGSYNGFFIRDDVDDDFKINWDNNTTTTNTPWRSFDKVDYLTSDWYDRDNSTSASYFSQGNETSQDQIIGLLMGFAFVKKYVDDNGPLNLVTEIQNITTRIFDYVTPIHFYQRKIEVTFNSNTVQNISPPFVGINENWIIMRPPPDAYNPVGRDGAEMGGFSYALAQIMYNITGTTTTPALDFNVLDPFWLPGCPTIIFPFNIRILMSQVGTRWNSLQTNSLPTIDGRTICSGLVPNPVDLLCWPKDVNINDVNMQMIAALAALADTWDPVNLKSALHPTSCDMFELMNSALHNHTSPTDQQHYKSQLDDALISGPSHDYGLNEWQSTNRYLHPGQTSWAGEYNGLDYMLLYNLYQLNYKSTGLLPDYKNTACPCSYLGINQPYLSSIVPVYAPANTYPVINPSFHQLYSTEYLERKFPEYLNYGISAPEYLCEYLIINNPIRSLYVNTELIVCNNTTLEIQATGILQVGEIGKNSVLRIKSGSTLKLGTGSQIILNDQSKVIIEPGAHFIYEPGALIYLQGGQTLFDVQTTNVNITIPNGQQFYCSRSGFSLYGGTIKFAGGTFNLNAGGNLVNDGCKIIMGPAMSFNYQANGVIQLSQTISEIQVLNPATTITIPNNNKFITTKYSSAEGGRIYFAGGNFDLQSHGIIENDGCKIELGDGMNLDYHQFSQIDLIGSFAMLYVNGTLHLHSHADFSFNNNGYIKLGLPNQFPNILCDFPSTITLTGQGKTDKVLEIADQTDVFLDYTTGLFKIQDAKVELGYMSSINVANPVNFNHSHFTSTIPSYPGYGLVLNGQSQLGLDNLTVNFMKYGMRARNFYSNGADFKLTNSDIGFCDYGMITWDKGVSLTHVNLHDCNFWGWQALGMTRPSRALFCQFNGTGQYGGIIYKAAGSSPLSIQNCEINNNAAVGLAIVGPTIANVICSEIKNNLEGNVSYPQVPYVCNAGIMLNAAINLSPVSLTHTLGGYNDFSSLNPQWVNNNALLSSWGWSSLYSKSTGGSTFYLQNGHNNFSKEENYRFGNGQFINTSLHLFADYNQWYQANLNPPDQADFLFKNNQFKFIFIDDASPDYFINCVVSPPGDSNEPNGRPYPLYSCSECPVVNSTRFNMVPLNQAILTAIDMTKMADTANGNDLTALQMLLDINDVCLEHDAEDVDFLFQMAYAYTKTTFGGAVKDSLIYNVNDSVFRRLVLMQTYLINKAIQNDDDAGEYYFTLDLAFSYLAINDRSEALNILNNLSPCIELSDEQYNFISYWKNLVSIENNILSGQSRIVDFDSLMEAGGWGSGNRIFYKDTKANIDTLMQDTVPLSAIQANVSVTDNNGNIFSVSGQTDSSYNYLLTRTDSLMQVIWSYSYDGRNHDSDIVKALCLDGLGNIYVTGKSWNGDNYEVCTVKFDSSGNQYWTAVYNSADYLHDEPTGIEVNQNGKLVVTGRSFNDSLVRYFRIEYSQCDSFCVPNYRGSTNSPGEKLAFSFSPNPVSGNSLSISYHLPVNEAGQFTIYDLQGRSLFTLILKANSSEQTINLPPLTNGIYYPVIQSGGKQITKKLAVLRE